MYAHLNPSPRTGSPRLAAAAAALVLTVALLAACSSSAKNSTTPTTNKTPVVTLDAQRIALMRSACRQWLNSHPTGTGAVPTGWCDDMGRWMTSQINGHHMTGVAIWGTPRTFATTCRNWAKTQPASAAQWCGRMVAWMSGHVGTWNDGQHWNDHMGGGANGNTGTTYPYDHMGGGANGNTGTTYPNNHVMSGAQSRTLHGLPVPA